MQLFEITFLDKSQKATIIPQLFDTLHENMSRIDPTGNTYEQDFRLWADCITTELENSERNILLIKFKKRLVGFFQYSVIGSVLFMEEIQICREYWGSGAFAELYRILASVIPEDVKQVRANASKKNLKSQAILEHLGLQKTGENKNRKSYCYSGDCRKIPDKYRI